jgi:hypothetical protein
MATPGLTDSPPPTHTTTTTITTTTTRYKYPPVWVTAADMFAAMDTIDSTSAKSRGWVTVEVNA